MKGYFIVLLTLFISITAVSADAGLLRLDNTDPLYVVWAEDSEIYMNKRERGMWLEKEQITDNDMNDFSPYIALDKGGNPWIVWIGNDGVSTAVYSRYWDGKVWSDIYQVDSVDLYSDTFPSIIIDNKNIPYVVWSGSDGKESDIYISSWKGSRWEPERMININDNSPDLMPVTAIQPEGEGLIVSWMGYNGRTYELYYAIYSKDKTGDEKVFGLGKTYSFGECPSFIKSVNGDTRLCWWEKGNCRAIKGNGVKWDNEEALDVSCKDKFIVELQERLSAPVCVAWIDTGLRQSFRLMPINKPRVFTGISIIRSYDLCSIFDFLNSYVYAEEVTTAPTKYIAFGDSITKGGGPPDEYPTRLEKKLDANVNIGPSTVINEGVGGERTFEGLDRINDVLNEYNAKYILIMEGTNDVTYDYAAEDIMFNLGEMIDRSVLFGTTPFIATLPPRRDSLNGRTHDEINPAIQALALEKTTICVDQYTRLAVDTEAYIADHVHPTPAGYEIVADQWYKAIDNLINPPSEGDGGCGSIVLPVGSGNGGGINLGMLFVLFIICLWFRVKLCRS